MNVKYIPAVLMAAGLLIAAPAFAQTNTAQKQHTQEGNSESFECGSPYNANPAADPDCKRHTQNLSPSSAQGVTNSGGSGK